MPSWEGSNELRLKDVVLEFNGATLTKTKDNFQFKRRVVIDIAGGSSGNVYYGISSPGVLSPTPIKGDVYIQSSTGTSAGILINMWAY